MSIVSREELCRHLEGSHSRWEDLLRHIDPTRDIYPGWTLRQMLAHLTGWDENTIATLTALQDPEAPQASAAEDFDEFNARTVSSREGMDFAAIVQEWRSTRNKLVTLLRGMPDESYHKTLVASWGETLSVPDLVQVLW